MVRFFLIALAATALLAAQSSQRCDRACLEGWLDRYIDAFVAYAPSRLRLSKGVMFTENGQRLEPRDGTWRNGEIGPSSRCCTRCPTGSGWSRWEDAMSSRPRW